VQAVATCDQHNMLNGTIPAVCCVQDVTWSLNVQKSGTDTMYQGAATGQITITNPQAVPVTVQAINSYVQGGPSGTVSCGTGLPLQVNISVVHDAFLSSCYSIAQTVMILVHLAEVDPDSTHQD
jgi:hypothetical protein